jgi:hypothetical protein
MLKHLENPKSLGETENPGCDTNETPGITKRFDPFFNMKAFSITYKLTPNLWQLLPPFQIIRHSKNLEESKYLKFDQNYKENYKNL